jgi:hypothetical protein
MFLSCSLRTDDVAQVNEYFDCIARLHDLELRTINIPGLSEKEVLELLKETIPKVDGVVVLWVPRYYINGALPSMWTIVESAIGIAKDKPVYVFFEKGISLEGPLKTIGKIQVEFNRWYFNDPQEHERLSKWIHWIKQDIESKKAEDLGAGIRTAIGIGLVALGIFGLGFFAGKSSKK